MPRIPVTQIQNYSVGVRKAELKIASILLNRKKVTVNADNVQVFKKLTILPNCEELTCNYMELEVLPQLPICRNLYVSVNNLVALPALPNCIDLNCSYNQLTELPELPNCTKLQCSHNQITKLPALQNCIDLDCSFNEITELPELSNCLYLYCYHNEITELPELPNCLELDCSFNEITELPECPNCLVLEFSENPIVEQLATFQTNLAWWDSQQQKQLKQQLRKQLTQQQKKQIQKKDPISLQQFQSPALGNDFAIYDDSTLTNLPFKGVRGLDVNRSVPLKRAVAKYKAQQDEAKKRSMKKDIAKYVEILQSLRGYGLQQLFGQQE